MFEALLLVVAQASAAPDEQPDNPLATAWPGIVCDQDAANSGDQNAMTMCAYQDMAAADEEMAQAYQRARTMMLRLDLQIAESEPDSAYNILPGHYETLISADLAWTTFREDHCALASFRLRGGSAAALALFGCKAEMARERTQQLRELVETLSP
ncbi:MAG: lysozyme inhibitor LprI family protein [Pseudomonadota bacterium]